MKVKLSIGDKKYEEVLSYDPGGTTGYARIRVDHARRELTVTEIGEFNTWLALEKHLSELDTNKTIVVYEDFITRTLTANTIPLEVIGVFKFLCVKYNIMFGCQQPVHRYAAEKWYPQLKVDFPSHYGSATRHAIVFAVTKLTDQKIYKLCYNKPKLRTEMLKR